MFCCMVSYLHQSVADLMPTSSNQDHEIIWAYAIYLVFIFAWPAFQIKMAMFTSPLTVIWADVAANYCGNIY